MEDIIEIYDPIYRETSKLPIYLIIISAVLLIGIIVFFIVKKIKSKTKVQTQEELYNSVINELTSIQSKTDKMESYKYSCKINNLYKTYLSRVYNKNYMAYTSEELITEFEENKLYDYLTKYIEPALFGKKQIELNIKNELLKEIVENITYHYKLTGETIA